MYICANFSVSWNITNNSFVPVYNAYIQVIKNEPDIIRRVYFANITKYPPIELIDYPPQWNIKLFWEDITYYQNNKLSDW